MCVGVVYFWFLLLVGVGVCVVVVETCVCVTIVILGFMMWFTFSLFFFGGALSSDFLGTVG